MQATPRTGSRRPPTGRRLRRRGRAVAAAVSLGAAAALAWLAAPALAHLR